MKKHLFPVIIFTTVLIYFICCIIIYGVSNISIYNAALFLFASPILEEYVFRGVIQKNINKFVNNKIFFHISFGSLISSLIFAGVHFFINRYEFISLTVFLPSLFFGYLYDEYKTLKLPVLFHGFFNISVFISCPLGELSLYIIDKL